LNKFKDRKYSLNRKLKPKQEKKLSLLRLREITREWLNKKKMKRMLRKRKTRKKLKMLPLKLLRELLKHKCLLPPIVLLQILM